MAKRFAGTHEHKVEARGRVSIPADFRKVFREQDSTDIYLVPQLRRADAHVCFTERGFDTLCRRIDESDRPPLEKEQMSEIVIGGAKLIEQDDNGRIVIPEELRALIGIGKDLVFVGLGDYFELRTPAGHGPRLAEAQEKARAGIAEISLTGLHR